MNIMRVLQEDPSYKCITNDVSCPEECMSLDNCMDCNCAVIDMQGGPWGSAMDVILCLLPIVFLLVVTLMPHPLPTKLSLPLSAIIMLLVRLMYLGSDPVICF